MKIQLQANIAEAETERRELEEADADENRERDLFHRDEITPPKQHALTVKSASTPMEGGLPGNRDLKQITRRRQRGHGTTKGLIGRTMLSTCFLKLCIFPSSPMQNNNVKSPQFASSANQNRDSKLF